MGEKLKKSSFNLFRIWGEFLLQMFKRTVGSGPEKIPPKRSNVHQILYMHLVLGLFWLFERYKLR
jgi:hypothetical protein